MILTNVKKIQFADEPVDDQIVIPVVNDVSNEVPATTGDNMWVCNGDNIVHICVNRNNM